MFAHPAQKACFGAETPIITVLLLLPRWQHADSESESTVSVSPPEQAAGCQWAAIAPPALRVGLEANLASVWHWHRDRDGASDSDVTHSGHGGASPTRPGVGARRSLMSLAFMMRLQLN